MYLCTSQTDDRFSSRGLLLLVLFLFIIYAVNLFGPPPPDVNAIAWTNLAVWLLLIWGYWIDRHRHPADGTTSGSG